MSLSADGVWKSGVWATTVWANGVWQEGAIQRGDWQIFYEEGKGRKKRWRKELLDRERLRAIIGQAVLGKVPAVAEYLEPAKQLARTPSDIGPVRDALEPKGRAIPYIDYAGIMADTNTLQSILSWYYKRPVEVISLDDDDDDILALMM